MSAFAAAVATRLDEIIVADPSTAAADALADAICPPGAPAGARRVAYRDAEDLLGQLRAIAAGAQRAAQRTPPDGAGPVFVPSGMGPQWWGMARTLLTTEGTFRATAEKVDAIFTELSGYR
ncbi:MAG: hypothetical protein IPG94_22205 [Kineosporiaceae bacterium]|nr:hypothetical protein [Kineosporiaceae bacterium]